MPDIGRLPLLETWALSALPLLLPSDRAVLLLGASFAALRGLSPRPPLSGSYTQTTQTAQTAQKGMKMWLRRYATTHPAVSLLDAMNTGVRECVRACTRINAGACATRHAAQLASVAALRLDPFSLRAYLLLGLEPSCLAPGLVPTERYRAWCPTIRPRRPDTTRTATSPSSADFNSRGVESRQNEALLSTVETGRRGVAT